MIRDDLKVLVVDDSEFDFELLAGFLKTEIPGLVTKRIDLPKDLMSCLNEETWDIIVSDYKMPQFSAKEVIKIVKNFNPDLPVIIMSGSVNHDVKAELLNDGASDFISKQNFPKLMPIINRELGKTKY